MIKAYTQEGANHVNQDVFGWQGNMIWVIDGATPLFGDDFLGGNDVQKTVRKISDSLKRYANDEDSLADIFFMHASLSKKNIVRQFPDMI